MKDIEKIYNIFIDKKYTNKILLEIELSKISDRTLALGALMELSLKHEGFGVDQEIPMDVLTNLASIEDMKNIREYHDNFREEILKITNSKKVKDEFNTLEKMKDIFGILLKSYVGIDPKEDIKAEDSQEFCDELKTFTKEEVEFFKNFLIERELYEMIVSIDKILS